MESSNPENKKGTRLTVHTSQIVFNKLQFREICDDNNNNDKNGKRKKKERKNIQQCFLNEDRGCVSGTPKKVEAGIRSLRRLALKAL